MAPMAEDEPAEGTEPRTTKHGGPPMRWWESKLVVTLLGGMLTAIVPLTAGVQAWVAKQQDRVLEQQKQQHALEMEYVDRAIDASKSALQRKHMLKFLVMTADERSRLKLWADEVLREVDQEIAEVLAERKAKREEEDRLQKEKAVAVAEVRAKSEKVVALKARGPEAPSQELASLESQRKAAESRAFDIDRRLVTVQASLAGLDNKLRADAPPAVLPVPIVARFVRVRAIEDGSLLRTRWTFRLLVNGRVIASVPSDLYVDGKGGERALHQSGAALAPGSQPIEVRIVGERDNGGPEAEGRARVTWDALGVPTLVEVQVPGDAKKGRFEFEIVLDRAPSGA